MKAGNEADVSRITFHTRQLHNVEGAAVKSHKSELKKLMAELTAIQKDQPTFAGRLAEAHNHLLALLQ